MEKKIWVLWVLEWVRIKGLRRESYLGHEERKKTYNKRAWYFRNQENEDDYRKNLLEYGLDHRHDKISNALINTLIDKPWVKHHGIEKLNNIDQIVEHFIEQYEKWWKLIDEEKKELIRFFEHVKLSDYLNEEIKKFVRRTPTQLKNEFHAQFRYPQSHNHRLTTDIFREKAGILLNLLPSAPVHQIHNEEQLTHYLWKLASLYTSGKHSVKKVDANYEYYKNIIAVVWLNNWNDWLIDTQNEQLITSLKTYSDEEQRVIKDNYTINSIDDIYFQRYTLIERYYWRALVEWKDDHVLFEKSKIIEHIDWLEIFDFSFNMKWKIIFAMTKDQTWKKSAQCFARTQDMKRKHLAKFKDPEDNKIYSIDYVQTVDNKWFVYCFLKDSDKAWKVENIPIQWFCVD